MRGLSAGDVRLVERTAGGLSRVAEVASEDLARWVRDRCSGLDACRDIVAEAETVQLVAHLAALCRAGGDGSGGSGVGDVRSVLGSLAERLGGTAADTLVEAGEAYSLLACYYDQIVAAFGGDGWSSRRSRGAVVSSGEHIALSPAGTVSVLAAARRLSALAADSHGECDRFVLGVAEGLEVVLAAAWSNLAGPQVSMLSDVLGVASPDLAPREVSGWLWSMSVAMPPAARPVVDAAAEAVSTLALVAARTVTTCWDLLEMCARP